MGVSAVSKKKLNMRKLQYILTTVLALIVCTSSLAQTKGFSKNPEVFIEELGQHVKKLKDKQVETTYDQFEAQWLSGVYTEDQQSLVIRLAEYMVLKKFKIKPDIELYMRTLIGAKDSTSGVSEEKFDGWLLNEYQLIKKDRRAFLKVLETSNLIFREHVLYRAIGKEWLFSNTDYKFVFEGTDVRLNLQNVDIICHGPDDSLIVRSEWNLRYSQRSLEWR